MEGLCVFFTQFVETVMVREFVFILHFSFRLQSPCSGSVFAPFTALSLRRARRYPQEFEVCLPPLSNFELLDHGRFEDGICIFRSPSLSLLSAVEHCVMESGRDV